MHPTIAQETKIAELLCWRPKVVFVVVVVLVYMHIYTQTAEKDVKSKVFVAHFTLVYCVICLLTSLLPHISPSPPFSGPSGGLSHLAGGIKPEKMTWDQEDKEQDFLPLSFLLWGKQDRLPASQYQLFGPWGRPSIQRQLRSFQNKKTIRFHRTWISCSTHGCCRCFFNKDVVVVFLIDITPIY